jgi:hypothetical protein
MSMLNTLAKASQSDMPVYHEFLMEWRPDACVIYAFMEGQDDLSFFTGAIQNEIPNEWSVRPWAVGNKRRVLQLLQNIDWNTYSRKQLLFFIDRDLDRFVKTDIIAGSNLYITTGHSIENYMVTDNTFVRTLKELCHLNALSQAECDCIRATYNIEHLKFRTDMAFVMSWLIQALNVGTRIDFSKIMLKELYSFQDGTMMRKYPKKIRSSLKSYLEAKFHPVKFSYRELKTTENNFVNNSGKELFIRGKFEIWYFVGIVNSIHKHITRFSIKYTDPPAIHTSLSCKNAIELIAPRVKTPERLRSFLRRTCVTYIKSYKLTNEN